MAATAVYYHPAFLEHDTGPHPESAPRLVAAVRALDESDVPFEWRTPGPAPLEGIERIHTAAHIDRVREVARAGGGHLDLDTAVSPASFDAAVLAAGAGIDAAAAAVNGGDRAFCLVRPPGHHARPERGMGFCLFNSIAIAAAHALEELGVERVLVVDWDVHHGNGTQEAFYEDPRVLFVSMHQQWHYPGTGWPEETGAGAGAGYTVNMPLAGGAGDGAARLFIEGLVEPLAHAYRPGLILVSAGYDSQAGDLLGGFSLSRDAYHWMSSRLAELGRSLGAAGPVFLLEGGYVPDMMAASIVATLEGLEAPAPAVLESRPAPDEIEALQRTVQQIGPHWPGILSSSG